MKNDYCPDNDIYLDGQPIGVIQHFMYLQQTLQMINQLSPEVKEKKGDEWIPLENQGVFLITLCFPLKIKAHSFNVSVLMELCFYESQNTQTFKNDSCRSSKGQWRCAWWV